MVSSKFSKSRRIQGLPPVCKKPPSPTDRWKEPFYTAPLMAYARWHWPGSPYGASVQESFSLQPGPVYAHWRGMSQQANHRLALELTHNYYAESWNLQIELWATGYLLDLMTSYQIPMRSTNPLWTETVSFVPPTAYHVIEAWVAL